MKLSNIKVDNTNSIGRSIYGSHRILIFLLGVITLFEIGLIVRGILVYDFSKLSSVLYMVAFGLLILASISAILFLVLYKPVDDNYKPVSYAVNIYAVFFLLWGTFLSYVDLSLNLYPIVYLTVIVGVGAVAILNPVFYTVIVTATMAVLIVLDRVLGIYYLNYAEYFNIGVFYLTSLFIAYRRYLVTINNAKTNKYLSKIALEDSATGFGNDSALIEEIDQTNNEIAERKAKFAVSIVEVTNTQAVSDVYGFKYSYYLINTVGHSLSQLFKDSKIYRTDGNRYIIVSKKEDYNQIDALKDNIEKSLNHNNVYYDKTELSLVLAYGSSKYKIGDSFNDVLKRARVQCEEMKK